MNPPQKILSFLKDNDNFIIASHISPDGDSIGSGIALKIMFDMLGKKSILLNKNTISNHYRFLPGISWFNTFKDIGKLNIKEFQNLILIDCNNLMRIAENKDHTIKFRTSIVIDHHKTKDTFGDIRWIEPDASATGLMIYYLIKKMRVQFNKEISENLYVAIMTDTGGFSYENTNSEVLKVVSHLAEFDLKPHILYRQIYGMWSMGKYNLFTKILNTAQIKDSIAIATLTLDMLKETKSTVKDTENLVDFFKIIKDVTISILIRELGKDNYKISLRSKDNKIDVSKIALLFGGGGHKNSAGYTIKANIKDIKNSLLSKIKDVLNVGWRRSYE